MIFPITYPSCFILLYCLIYYCISSAQSVSSPRSLTQLQRSSLHSYVRLQKHCLLGRPVAQLASGSRPIRKGTPLPEGRAYHKNPRRPYLKWKGSEWPYTPDATTIIRLGPVHAYLAIQRSDRSWWGRGLVIRQFAIVALKEVKWCIGSLIDQPHSALNFSFHEYQQSNVSHERQCEVAPSSTSSSVSVYSLSSSVV